MSVAEANLLRMAADLRVTVSCGGRFHAFALARELARRGALERLLTTDVRALREPGLPLSRTRVFPHLELLPRAAARLPGAGELPWAHWKARLHDHTARRFLGSPNVVVAWSGQARESLKAARRRGALAVLERGSSHIEHQHRVLVEEFDRWGVAHDPILPEGVRNELVEYALADLVVVPSTFARRTFLAHGLPPEKVVQVPYGADLSMFRPGPPPADGVFRVAFTGAIALRKGVPYLLEAWRQLALPNAELLLIGNVWDEMKPLLTRYDGLYRAVGGLSRPEVAALLRTASVFAFPSLEEGLSLALLEALASGLPVVATDASGVEDVLDDGVEGFVVKPRDVDGMAAALERLYREPDLRRELASRTTARAQGRTWDAYGDGVVAAYRQGLARLAPGAA